MNLRASIGFGLKISISAALIYWILKDADFRQIWETISRANMALLFVAFLMFFVGYTITGTRWRLLLGAQGVTAKLGFLVRSFMVAMFFNNFLPSTVGGDAVRVYDSWRLGKSKSRALSVIFVDRLLGGLALAVLAVFGMTFATPLTQRLPALPLWIGVIAIAAMLLALMIFRPPQKLLSYLEDSRLPIPGVIRKLLAKIIDAFILFKDRHDVLLPAVLLSFALQVNVIVYFYFLSVALGFDVPMLAFFLIVPVATATMMLPISINGIGVREGIFALLLLPYGIGNEGAIALAWVSYGFILLQGLLGGLVFALRNESAAVAGGGAE